MRDDKVRLFNAPGSSIFDTERRTSAQREYIARPVADDDAREDRIEKLRDEGFALHRAYYDVVARAEKAERDRDRARAELAAQRELWQQIPGGPDYEADENDTSPSDAGSHLAGIAIRRIDAESAECDQGSVGDQTGGGN